MLETIKIMPDFIQLLDQRVLPFDIRYMDIKTVNDAYMGIRDMVVRGAPAIGVAGAFGISFAVREKTGLDYFIMQKNFLLSSRPTAVNLAWGLEKQERLFRSLCTDKDEKEAFGILFENAQKLYHQDIRINKKIGECGQKLIDKNSTVITHCNAGALATCGWGTALGVIRSAFKKGKINLVYADETRPYLQGSRLTAWELGQDNIPVRVITDSSSGYILKNKKVACAVVGADRIASNGDTANKIGTYLLAINCRYHKVPFYVAAPLSTFDPSLADGSEIVIEERDRDEIRRAQDCRIIPEDIDTENPSFDITPSSLITAYITEKGVYEGRQLRKMLEREYISTKC